MSREREDSRSDNRSRDQQLDGAREIQERNNTEPPPDTTTETVEEIISQEEESQPPIIVTEGDDRSEASPASTIALQETLVVDDNATTNEQVTNNTTNIQQMTAEIANQVSERDSEEIVRLGQQVASEVARSNVSDVQNITRDVSRGDTQPLDALVEIARQVSDTRTVEAIEEVRRISAVGPTGPTIVSPRPEREQPRTRTRPRRGERIPYGPRPDDIRRMRETTNSLLNFTDDLKTMNYILKKFNPTVEANLFTRGGEFIDFNFREYVGPYHKRMDGTLVKGKGKVGEYDKLNKLNEIFTGGPFTDPELLAGRRSYVPPAIVEEVAVERSRRRAARRRGERPGAFESRQSRETGVRPRRVDPADRMRSVGPRDDRQARPTGYDRDASTESRTPLIDTERQRIEETADRMQDDRDSRDGINRDVDMRTDGRDTNTRTDGRDTNTRTENQDRTAEDRTMTDRMPRT